MPDPSVGHRRVSYGSVASGIGSSWASGPPRAKIHVAGARPDGETACITWQRLPHVTGCCPGKQPKSQLGLIHPGRGALPRV